MRFGDPRLPVRFWSKVVLDEGTGCWRWTASTSHGYGQIGYRAADGAWRPRRAHVVAYTALVGPVPDDVELDHLCHSADASCAGGPTCRHRRCCNPAHLEVVTAEENNRRGRGGQHWAQKTHCPKGHPYDQGLVHQVRRPSGSVGPHRKCRECNVEFQRAYREKVRARRAGEQ